MEPRRRSPACRSRLPASLTSKMNLAFFFVVFVGGLLVMSMSGPSVSTVNARLAVVETPPRPPIARTLKRVGALGERRRRVEGVGRVQSPKARIVHRALEPRPGEVGGEGEVRLIVGDRARRPGDLRGVRRRRVAERQRARAGSAACRSRSALPRGSRTRRSRHRLTSGSAITVCGVRSGALDLIERAAPGDVRRRHRGAVQELVSALKRHADRGGRVAPAQAHQVHVVNSRALTDVPRRRHSWQARASSQRSCRSAPGPRASAGRFRCPVHPWADGNRRPVVDWTQRDAVAGGR